MTLPTIYKPTKTGKVQMCSITIDGPTFTVEFGQVGGKTQTKTTICEPKNIGRANETTAESQAHMEAVAKHVLKMKSGYVLDPSGLSENGEMSVKLPQKVKVYQDQLHNIDDEVYVSPKYNGVNAIFRLGDNGFAITSRGGELYPAIPHVENELRYVMSVMNLDEVNGELYIHGEHLQDIQSAVTKTNPMSERLMLRIFELPTYGETYKERVGMMELLPATEHVKIAPIKLIAKEGIDMEFAEVIANGYEGLMVRNAGGEYTYNQRSSNVFKYKVAQDAEFQISHYTIDKNGHPVFLCHTEDGKPFKVKPKGTHEERLTIVENIDDYLNHWYAVEFEAYSKTGVPLKPVGLGLRNCDSEGEPLE